MQAPFRGTKFTVEALRGLNERKKFSNDEPGVFDILRGVVPTTFNTLTRPGGIQILQMLQGEMILGICQTNDSNGNIIVQTDKAIRIINESDFFGDTVATNLVPVPNTDDDIMPRALLQHSATSGTAGGTLAATLTQMPMSEIVSQVNADGTAAAFCTLATNQWTLQAGVYILKGWHYVNNVNPKITSGCIFNITAGAKAWTGATNQDSNQVLHSAAGLNVRLEFMGVLTLAAPTILEWRGVSNTARATDGLGIAAGITSTREVFGQLEILKTA